MDFAESILEQLERDDNLRRLCTVEQQCKYITVDGRRYINMSSNDYLGLACLTAIQKGFLEKAAADGRFLMSNSASRLMTGNSREYDELEASIAALYPGKSALVLGSGYAVNSGLLQALTDRQDAVVADKLVHASLADGLRLCSCHWERFAHNDMERLGKIVKELRASDRYRNIWVVTESVFSMDGDRAPLAELAELKERYGLKLIIDEAHAFGVYGPGGEGLAAELGLDREIDITIGTLGKATASAGGFIAASPVIRELLVNRMRTLIFSTAMPPINLMWSKLMVDSLPHFGERRRHLQNLIARLKPGSPEATQIIPLMTYDNGKAVELAGRLKETGFWVTPIRYPTVAKGRARVRISLTAAMDENDIDRFMEVCGSIG